MRRTHALGHLCLVTGATSGIGRATAVELSRRGAGMSCSDLERMIALNVTATIELVAAVLPGMLERGSGHVVVIGSIAGRVGRGREAAYAATGDRNRSGRGDGSRVAQPCRASSRRCARALPRARNAVRLTGLDATIARTDSFSEPVEASTAVGS
jgi:hypothetical protein